MLCEEVKEDRLMEEHERLDFSEIKIKKLKMVENKNLLSPALVPSVSSSSLSSFLSHQLSSSAVIELKPSLGLSLNFAIALALASNHQSIN